MNLFYKLVLISFLISSPNLLRSQECPEFEFYELIFKELHPTSIDSLAFSFDYKISNFIINSVQSTDLFSESEQAYFIANVNKQSECITNHISLKTLSSNPPIPKANGNYIKKHYTLPIALSENKKILFSYTSIANINYEGGKAFGNEILFVFEKNKDQWSIAKKLSLAQY